MNKLTEIKECVYVLNHEMTHSRGAFCTAEDKVQAYGLEWIEHLLSLLEEKDKALAFYADNDNWENGHAKYNDEGDKVGNESYVEEDGGDIARAALTSSNTEGDM